MSPSCCKRYKRKGRACGKCPRFPGLSIQEIKRRKKKAKR